MVHCSPHVQKPNWMKDSLTLIKDIHTKSIHLQTILSIGHERNRCRECSYSMEQKKHIPLAIFLVFNASFNDKTLTITLQMNVLPFNVTWHWQTTSITRCHEDISYLESLQLYNSFLHPYTSLSYIMINIICLFFGKTSIPPKVK